jgi:hypothetical protein
MERGSKITNAQQILDIIRPIPAEKFCRNKYIDEDGRSCFLGHIHLTLAPDEGNWKGDEYGYGARQLTRRFMLEKHGMNVDGTDVNNDPDYNGYTEPEVKDRVVHMLEDMVAAGY